MSGWSIEYETRGELVERSDQDVTWWSAQIKEWKKSNWWKLLQWFAHVKRIKKQQMKMTVTHNITNVNLKWKPWIKIIDNAKRALDERGLSSEQGRALLRHEWEPAENN